MSAKRQFRTHAPQQKVVLFATSLPRLSIGCFAIIKFIATAVSNGAGRPANDWSNANSWLAKPSQDRAVSARLTVIARRTVTCCHTTNTGSCRRNGSGILATANGRAIPHVVQMRFTISQGTLYITINKNRSAWLEQHSTHPQHRAQPDGRHRG